MKIKEEWLYAILFIFSGIICAAIYCLFDHKLLTDIYLPSGLWNDEAFYFKQIEGAVSYGIPQGYFGYAETGANFLTFGAWSITILFPYILWGKIVGWGEMSPIYCNLFLVTVALLIFYLWAKPLKRQIFSFCLILVCSPLIVRYIISGMTEALFFSAAIIMAGMYFKLKRGEYGEFFLIFSYILIGYFSLGRPYILLMLFLPFWFWQKKSFWKATCVTALYGILILIIYSIISNFLCAPYFTPIINWDFTDRFISGELLGGLYDTAVKYMKGCKEVFGYLSSVFRESEIGEYYLYFIAVNIIIIVLGLKRRKKIILFTIGYNIIVLSAVIMLYSTKAGARHMLMLYVWGIVFISMYSKVYERILFMAMMLGILLFIPKNEYTYSVPYKEEEAAADGETIKEELSNILQLDDEIGWNNTVAWIINSEYGICYFLPAGFGINIDFDGIPCDQIKSRYILVKKSTETSNSLMEKALLIWEHGEYALYDRRN